MKIGRFERDGVGRTGVVLEDEVIDLARLNGLLGTSYPTSLDEILAQERMAELAEVVAVERRKLEGKGSPLPERFLAPLLYPPKIWCIGLNYRDHASDLDETSPEEPASFMRPAFSIIGPGDIIHLPETSERVTGEGELALVIGRRARNISEREAPSVVAGFLPAIDMTAEDILRRNPRFLTRAKSFDTFLSIGPYLVTPDEIGGPEAVREIRTSTLLNGKAERSNQVAQMRHDPFALVSFHSRGMTWLPGDLLLCGTPGAVVLASGDRVGSEVSGVGRLENPVTRDGTGSSAEG